MNRLSLKSRNLKTILHEMTAVADRYYLDHLLEPWISLWDERRLKGITSIVYIMAMIICGTYDKPVHLNNCIKWYNK